MPFIKITVTGLNEAISFFDNMRTQLPRATQSTLNEAADLFVTEAKNNAHVITGRMKASIHKGTVTNNSITVEATAPYSAFENRRSGTKPGQGSHNFATRAAETTLQKLPSIITKNFNQVFKP